MSVSASQVYRRQVQVVGFGGPQKPTAAAKYLGRVKGGTQNFREGPESAPAATAATRVVWSSGPPAILMYICVKFIIIGTVL